MRLERTRAARRRAQEHRIWGADAAGPARQDHGGDEQSQKLFELAHTVREDMDDIVTREHAELPAENGMRTEVLPVTREARRANGETVPGSVSTATRTPALQFQRDAGSRAARTRSHRRRRSHPVESPPT